LTNLRSLAGHRIEAMFLPLCIRGANGAPARVVACISERYIHISSGNPPFFSTVQIVPCVPYVESCEICWFRKSNRNLPHNGRHSENFQDGEFQPGHHDIKLKGTLWKISLVEGDEHRALDARRGAGAV
jgi:hypothetical protein